MASLGLPVEKLREYLRDLKPGARALLIAELERGLLRGDDVPGGEMLLQELRRSIRESTAQAPRIADPARLFFQPLEPYLVDDAANHNHRGRIARVSLEQIWTWICRDLVRNEAKAYIDDVNRALGTDDLARCQPLAAKFYACVAERVGEALDATADDNRTRQRLASQVGTARALEDIQSLFIVLKARDVLGDIGARLPGHIKNLSDDLLRDVMALVNTMTARDRDVFPYALLLVMSRLAHSWQLIRLATAAAETDAAARVAATPYAVAVDIVINEIERMVGELRADLRSGRGVAVMALLKTIHNAVRGVRSELDLSGDSPWGRQLAAIRIEISSLLKSEIESAPGRVRRLLRPRAPKDVTPGAVLDTGDVAEVETLIAFVEACRHYAGELAINEMTLRSYSELRQYLEMSAETLIEGLRQPGAGDWAFRQSQVEAAIRFCAKVFGADYAATLAKAAEVAAQNAATERKTAKA